MDAVLALPSAADLAGLAAAACLIGCQMLQSRCGMVGAQFGAGVFFAIHYALLGIDAASFVCALGAVQSAAALFAPRRPILKWTGYVLIPLMIAAGLAFWEEPVSAISIAAMTIVAYARMLTDEVELRLTVLCGTLLWTAHDALIGSAIALGADLTSGLIGLVVLIGRHRRGRFVAPGRSLRQVGGDGVRLVPGRASRA